MDHRRDCVGGIVVGRVVVRDRRRRHGWVTFCCAWQCFQRTDKRKPRQGHTRPDTPGHYTHYTQRSDTPRQAHARPRKTRQGRPDKARQGQTRPDKARQGQTRPDKARQGQTRPDKARQGQTRHTHCTQRSDTPRQAHARPRKTRQGQTRPDKARQGQTRPDKARQGQTRPDKARHAWSPHTLHTKVRHALHLLVLGLSAVPTVGSDAWAFAISHFLHSRCADCVHNVTRGGKKVGNTAGVLRRESPPNLTGHDWEERLLCKSVFPGQ